MFNFKIHNSMCLKSYLILITFVLTEKKMLKKYHWGFILLYLSLLDKKRRRNIFYFHNYLRIRCHALQI